MSNMSCGAGQPVKRCAVLRAGLTRDPQTMESVGGRLDRAQILKMGLNLVWAGGGGLECESVSARREASATDRACRTRRWPW